MKQKSAAMKSITSFFTGARSHSQASSAASAHKTVDKEFDREKERLKAFIGEAQELLKALKAQEHTVKAVLVGSLADMDAGMKALYGESNSAYLAFQKLYVNVQSASFVLEDEQKKAVDRMNECLAAANGLKKAVAERDAKVAEVDRACAQVFQLQGGRDASKAQTAMARYRTLKDEYEKVNADTMYQIRTFLHQRPERFDVHVKAAMQAWDNFLQTGASLFASVESTGGAAMPSVQQPPADAAAAGKTDFLTESTANEQQQTAAAAAPEPSTAKSRAEKFGVRMLPIAPTSPTSPTTAAITTTAEEPAQQKAGGNDTPPPRPPKPAR